MIALEARLKRLPVGLCKERKAVAPAAVSELAAGERADVSWITTKAIDRQQEVLVVKVIDETHVVVNPLVTLNHNNWLPFVGRSPKRKGTRDCLTGGVTAKTHYSPHPTNWPAGDEWAPDSAFALGYPGADKRQERRLNRHRGLCPVGREGPQELRDRVGRRDCIR